MTMTTNRAPMKEKLGIPEGEAEITHSKYISRAQQDEERENENDPTIDEAFLGDGREYIVGVEKSSDKKFELRKKLRRQPGKKIKRFIKKGGAG